MDTRRWIGSLLAGFAACAEPSTDDAEDGSSEGSTSTSGTSTDGDTTSAADSTSEDTSTLVQCPGGQVSARWDVTLPERPPEVSELEVTATCTIATPPMQADAEWTLALTCDELDGNLAQPYAIAVEADDSPFASLGEKMLIDLHYVRWHGDEGGSGARLSLVQDGTSRVLAIAESVEGGVSTCAAPSDTFRAAANEWLEPIGARVEPAGCDPESQFRIVRTFDGGDTYAYPGAATSLGELQAKIEDARCLVQETSGAEMWALRFVIWAD